MMSHVRVRGREFTHPQPLPKPALTSEAVSKGGKGLLLCDESTPLPWGRLGGVCGDASSFGWCGKIEV